MTETTVNKNLERKLRRALHKHGYSLHKSRKQISADNLGGYMIEDTSLKACVAGSRYDYTLDDVAEWLAD